MLVVHDSFSTSEVVKGFKWKRMLANANDRKFSSENAYSML